MKPKDREKVNTDICRENLSEDIKKDVSSNLRLLQIINL